MTDISKWLVPIYDASNLTVLGFFVSIFFLPNVLQRVSNKIVVVVVVVVDS